MIGYENRTPDVTLTKLNTVNIRRTQLANLNAVTWITLLIMRSYIHIQSLLALYNKTICYIDCVQFVPYLVIYRYVIWGANELAYESVDIKCIKNTTSKKLHSNAP